MRAALVRVPAERDAALEEKRVGAHLLAVCTDRSHDLEVGYDRMRAALVRAEVAESALTSALNHEAAAESAFAALRSRIDAAPVAEWCEACQQAMQLSFGGDCGPCGRPLRRVRLVMIDDPEVPNG